MRFRAFFLFFSLTCAAGLIACGGGSGGSSGPTAPAPTPNPAPTVCANIAGAWNGRWSMTPCGADVGGTGQVIVAQTGCSIGLTVQGLGSFTGFVDGNRSNPNLTLNFFPTTPGSGASCPNPSQGGLTVEADGDVVIPFGTGPQPACCQHGVVFLTR